MFLKRAERYISKPSDDIRRVRTERGKCDKRQEDDYNIRVQTKRGRDCFEYHRLRFQEGHRAGDQPINL